MSFKYFLYSIICFLSLVNKSDLLGQNLILDPSFDEIECPDNDINSIELTPTWYATGSDAYLLNTNCPLDPNIIASIVALNPNILPYRGIGYISLESVRTANGYFIAEGIATELTKILQADHFYYFEMATLNYDIRETPDTPEGDCDSFGRYLEVRFSDEPISIYSETTQIGFDFFTTGIFDNSKVRLYDQSSDAPDFKNNQWNPYWDCFEAEGNEKHIAISGNNFQLNPDADCKEEDNSGLVFFSGHGVDAVKLLELPKFIDTTSSICPGGGKIVLSDFVDPTYSDKGTYVWSDGFTGAERLITEEGIYNLEFILPCVSIPISLEVVEFPCKAELYVPNIFSPNNDGINDELIPGIFSIYEISNYNFQIFNRWGEIVFQTNDPEKGWDGRIKNKFPTEGMYAWQITYYLDFEEGLNIIESGDVILIH